MHRHTTRRAALLGAAGLLAGCDTLDSILGESKKPLPGERLPVLAARRELEPDSATAGPMVLPPAEARADWAQPSGNAAHAPGHPALGGTLAEAWRASIGTGSSYRRRITAGPVVAGGTARSSPSRPAPAPSRRRSARRLRNDEPKEGGDASASSPSSRPRARRPVRTPRSGR